MKSIVGKLKDLFIPAERKEELPPAPAISEELPSQPDITCETERFGTIYGGWDVATTNLNSESIVYSFGVGEDASFDIALMAKFNLTVHAFDPTPKSIEWVQRQGFSDRFVMHEYGLAAFDGEASFNPPVNPEHVSHTLLERPATKSNAITVPLKTLRTVMRELGHDAIDILKMDIEGAEYDVIDDLSRSDIRPQQILIEFHHRFPGVGLPKTIATIKQIRKMGYQLFSISASKQEFAFIRTTLVSR